MPAWICLPRSGRDSVLFPERAGEAVLAFIDGRSPNPGVRSDLSFRSTVRRDARLFNGSSSSSANLA
jgi:hypothetical protein